MAKDRWATVRRPGGAHADIANIAQNDPEVLNLIDVDFSSSLAAPPTGTAGTVGATTERGRGPGAVVMGVVAGVLIACLLYALLDSGVVAGSASLAVLLGLLVMGPTAPSLGRRVALNGAMLIGWVPLLWWVHWPVPLNHGAFVVSVWGGSLFGLVACAPQPMARLRTFVPRIHALDGTLVLAGLTAFAAMHHWALTHTPRRALEVLLPGADNYPHFNMFSVLRAHGATLDAVSQTPDRTGWAFDNYPQGFHAFAATLSELSWSGADRGPEMLIAYTHAVAAVVVFGMIVLTASIVSVPSLRDRPAIAFPAVVITWAAFLWEPGQHVLADGFANFWLGAVAAGCALLLAVSASRFLPIAEVGAVCGLLVAVVHAWTPLVIIAAPALLALAVGRRQPELRQARRRRVQVSAVLLSLALAAILKAVFILFATVEVKYLVTTLTGGQHGTSPLPTFVLMIASFYVCLSYPGWAGARSDLSPEHRWTARRVRILSLAPLAGFLSLASLFIAQLLTMGTTAYYFLKYLVGYELILAAVVPAICGMLIATVIRPSGGPRTAMLVSVVATVAASQFFGFFPRGTPPLLDESGAGTAPVGAPFSRSGIAEGILKAAGSTTSEQGFSREYVPLGAGRTVQGFYADAWFHSITNSLSWKVFGRYAVMRTHMDAVDSAAPIVREMLLADPHLQIVVDPTFVVLLRDRLQPDLVTRVLGWDDPRLR